MFLALSNKPATAGFLLCLDATFRALAEANSSEHNRKEDGILICGWQITQSVND
jgi:hypothetical protein